MGGIGWSRDGMGGIGLKGKGRGGMGCDEMIWGGSTGWDGMGW